DIGPRLVWLDLLVRDRDNAPATVADLDDWKTKIDAPEKLAIDPDFQFRPVNPGRGPLPMLVLIDTKTMSIRNYLTDPDPQTLEVRLRQELATLDGAAQPRFPPEEKFDGLFYRNQWDLLHDITVPGAPPPDPTNAKADDPSAAALGKRLFADE